MSRFVKKMCRGPYGAPLYASHELVPLSECWDGQQRTVLKYLCQRCFETFNVEEIEKANLLRAQEVSQ